MLNHEAQQQIPEAEMSSGALINNLIQEVYTAYEDTEQAFQHIAEFLYSHFNANIALALLVTLNVALGVSYAQSAFAQSDNPTPISGYNPETGEYTIFDELPEVTAAQAEVLPSVDLHVNSLDEIKSLIQKGANSQNFNLYFNDLNVRNEVYSYLTENRMFFSTGRIMREINADFISENFPKDHIFFLETDSQPLAPIYAEQTTNKPLPDGMNPPNPIQQSVETIEHEDGIIEKTTTITSTEVTKYQQFTGPWETNIAQTPLLAQALENGSYMIATSPKFCFMDDPKNPECIQSYAIYTGLIKNENGEWDAPYNYTPIHTGKGSTTYHAHAIAEVVTGMIQSQPRELSQRLSLITSDSQSFGVSLNKKGSAIAQLLIQKIIEANNQDQGNRIIITNESYAGAVDDMNTRLQWLEEQGIDFTQTAFGFSAAGNSGQQMTESSKYLENNRQFMATNPSVTAPTVYTNYILKSTGAPYIDDTIAGRGDFLTHFFVIKNGQLVSQEVRLNGTSMTTPLAATTAAFWLAQNEIMTDTTLYESVFPTKKQLIFGLDSTAVITTPAQIADINSPDLNNILLQTQQPFGFDAQDTLRLQYDWSGFHERIRKADGKLPSVGLTWDELIYELTPYRYLYPKFPFNPSNDNHYRNIKFLFQGDKGEYIPVNGYRSDAFMAKLKEMIAAGELPAQIDGREAKGVFTYEEYQVGYFDLPKLEPVDEENFATQFARMQRIDPDFGQPIPEVEPPNFTVYLPLIQQ